MTNNEQNLYSMIRTLQPMNVFVIGEAGSSTHQPACPTLTI